MQKRKILVSGDVCGNFDTLFSKVAKVNKAHGPFDALFCVGNFFQPTEGMTPQEKNNANSELLPYIQGDKQVPLATYFVCGAESDDATETFGIDEAPDGAELCANLVYLGRQGITTVAGLTIAFLSGIYSPAWYRDTHQQLRNHKYENHYIKSDVDAMLSKVALHKTGVDVFLTSEWPRDITNATPAEELPKELKKGSGSPILREILPKLPTRYFFAGTEGVYYQRPPFKTSASFARFYGLGKVGGEAKHKSLYACNLSVASSMPPEELVAYPSDITEGPFTAPIASAAAPQPKEKPDPKRQKVGGRFDHIDHNPVDREYNRWGLSDVQIKTGRVPPKGYVCNICHSEGHMVQDCPRKDAADKLRRGPLDEPPQNYICRRCGQKGHFIEVCPAVDDAKLRNDCWFCLGAPGVNDGLVVGVGNHAYLALDKGALTKGHSLILPIAHAPSTLHLTPDAAKDIAAYKHAMRTCFAAQRQSVMFYERHIPTRAQQHMHIQAIPVPESVSLSAARDKIINAGRSSGLQFDPLPSIDHLSSSVNKDDPYLVIELGEKTVLLHRVNRIDRSKTAFNFCREIFAHILGVPERADWKACQMSEKEEEKAAADLRGVFGAYDPFPA